MVGKISPEQNRLLIFYDYFYPGYKAGGPIQSLTNLAIALNNEYRIYVVTSPRDLHSSETYNDIVINEWNSIKLPGSDNAINVYYADSTIDRSKYLQIFEYIVPAVAYFNNIYSSFFFRLPLSALNGLVVKPKIVICPRGMLQKGALAVKPLKKKIYLNYLRFTGKLNKAYWHATNQEEANDIEMHFPKNQGIVVASNIPKLPYSNISFPAKEAGQLRLVYLSLITEKKNLLLLLQVIRSTETNVTLDIYGPVTDEAYWQQCSTLIKQMPRKVKYKGDVQPAKVQEVLSQYQALILLTKGENFGHALYESLSVGRPVITSFFTPWNDLEQKKAGINADINSINDCRSKISVLANLNQEEYNAYCTGANRLAIEYYSHLNTEIKYRQLFS